MAEKKVSVRLVAEGAAGDSFEIGGVIYEVRGEPLRDAQRHVWKVEAREV